MRDHDDDVVARMNLIEIRARQALEMLPRFGDVSMQRRAADVLLVGAEAKVWLHFEEPPSAGALVVVDHLIAAMTHEVKSLNGSLLKPAKAALDDLRTVALRPRNRTMA